MRFSWNWDESTADTYADSLRCSVHGQGRRRACSNCERMNLFKRDHSWTVLPQSAWVLYHTEYWHASNWLQTRLGFVTRSYNSPLHVVEVEVTLWLTVSQSVYLDVGHPFGAHDQILPFPFFCRKIALLFVLRHPLAREDGSVVCSAICQWSESRRTHNHTVMTHLRLLGARSVASYDSQGLRWEYSYPSPHGVLQVRMLSLLYAFDEPHRERHFQQLLYCCVARRLISPRREHRF
jgi:hypothetical protein